ncbi:MAG: hypothetical protein ACKVX9_01655 [Blastocatellia bacterium]
MSRLCCRSAKVILPRVAETWSQWLADGYIVHDPAADLWRKANPREDLPLSGARSATRKYLRDRFPDDTPAEREQWHMVLQLCAAEGETFTPDCVADALEWDREEMHEFLDDFFVNSDDNPDGPLLEPVFHRFLDKRGDERAVWRYLFASAYTWVALERDDDPRLNSHRARLADSLRELYDETEGRLAARLATIYERVGAEAPARHFARIADHGNQVDRMAAAAFHAIHLWKQMRRRRRPDGYAARCLYDLLQEAGKRMFYACPYAETFRVFYAAARIARDLPDPLDAVEAQNYCAMLLRAMGRNFRARRLYERLLDRLAGLLASQGVKEQVGSRHRLKSLQASCLDGLASIALMQSAYESSSSLYREALSIAREIQSRNLEAAILSKMEEIEEGLRLKESDGSQSQ